MSVKEVCSRAVATIDRDTDLVEAAETMRAEHVGDLIVTDSGSGRAVPVGMLTDRDIVLEVVARNIPPSEIRAGEAMVNLPFTLSEESSLHYALSRMHEHGVRRAVVVEKSGDMTGVLSIADALDYAAGLLSDVAGAARRVRHVEIAERP